MGLFGGGGGSSSQRMPDPIWREPRIIPIGDEENRGWPGIGGSMEVYPYIAGYKQPKSSGGGTDWGRILGMAGGAALGSLAGPPGMALGAQLGGDIFGRSEGGSGSGGTDDLLNIFNMFLQSSGGGAKSAGRPPAGFSNGSDPMMDALTGRRSWGSQVDFGNQVSMDYARQLLGAR